MPYQREESMMGEFHYEVIGMPKINEGFFEDVVVERLVNELGYEHLYGPDVVRTDDAYRDVSPKYSWRPSRVSIHRCPQWP